MNTEPTHRTSHLLAEVTVRSEEKGLKESELEHCIIVDSFIPTIKISVQIIVRNQSTNLSGFHVFPPSSTFPSRPMARLVPARRVREGENAAAEPTRRVETASFMVMEDAVGKWHDDETRRTDEQ